MTTDAQAIALPFDEAIAFFRQKTNIPTKRWTDVWKEAHSRGFMVAGAASEALLTDFRASIDKALAQGTTLAEFRADFDAIVQRHGWEYHGTPGWRSRVIYETNLSTAYSAGRYAQMTDPDVLAAYPYWQYVHSGSRHPRLMHLGWDGLTLRADDPFWATHYPPNGWHCGCRVRPVSERGLGRLGKSGPDQAPPLRTRTWVDKVTGESHQVPVGIDPGFDYNPGQAWHAPVKTDPMRPEPSWTTPAHPGKREPMPPLPVAFERFFEEPKGELHVGALPPQLKDVLKTDVADVRLSGESYEKQVYRHPDLSAEDYAVLPEMIARPTVVQRQTDNKVALLLRRSGRVYQAVVKAADSARRLYLVSFRRADAKSVRQELRKHEVLAGDADDLK